VISLSCTRTFFRIRELFCQSGFGAGIRLRGDLLLSNLDLRCGLCLCESWYGSRLSTSNVVIAVRT